MDHPDFHPQRILMIRPSALGDVSRTVPCLTTLRKAYPEARIDWIVRDIFADVIRAHPDLNEAIHFPRNAFSKALKDGKAAHQATAFLKSLKSRNYDLVYDFQGLFRSGLMAWATGAYRRVGPANARELGWWGYHAALQVKAGPHTVDQMMGLLATDGLSLDWDMRLHTPPEEQVWACEFLDEHHLMDKPYLVVAPTARWLSKRWPIEKFANVASKVSSDLFAGVIVIGSPGEEEQTRPFFKIMKEDSHMPVYDLVGQTSVGGMMAILEKCRLLLCNDSAALHIAVGYGRACVSIFGTTDPAKVGPFRYDDAVIAAPGCESLNYRASGLDQNHISQVTEEQVLERIDYNVQNQAPDPKHKW